MEVRYVEAGGKEGPQVSVVAPLGPSELPSADVRGPALRARDRRRWDTPQRYLSGP